MDASGELAVLYVDADRRQSVSTLADDERFEVSATADTAAATERIEARAVHCVVTSPSLDGWLSFAERACENVPVVLVGAEPGDITEAGDAIAEHVRADAVDPVDVLARRIESAVVPATLPAGSNDQFYRDLVHEASDAILVVDEASTIRFVNDTVEELFGYEPDQLRGEPLTTLIPQSLEEDHNEGMDTYLETGERTIDWDYVELPGRHRDGRELTLAISFDEHRRNGERLFSGIVRDVTERNARERRLREYKRQFDAVFGDPDSFIILLDPDGIVRKANKAALEFAGTDFAQVNGMPFWNTAWWDHPSAPREKLKEWIERAADGESVRYESTHHAADDATVTIDGTIRPVTNEDGRVVSLIAQGKDISERNRIQQELQASERSLRKLYEITSDPELTFEEKLRRILDVGRERLGLSLGFMTRIEDDTQEIVTVEGEHELLREGATSPLSQAYCEATVESDEVIGAADAAAAEWVDGDTYERWGLSCYLGGKIEVHGELYGTFCFADDATREKLFSDSERTFVELLAQWASQELERKRRQEQLEAANAELAATNQRLEQFASVVSHDIRNPLTVAMGHLDAAQERTDDEQLDEVERSLRRIDNLIDDLLTLARQGESVGETETVAPDAVARDAWETVDTPEAAIEVSDPPTVQADESRLRQLFENLFRNAVEHGPDDVTVRVGGLDARRGFYVEDDGPGIPEGEREQVFEQGHTTAPDGTGFGLAIVEQVVDAHDWTITLGESEAGGARFEIGVETSV
ncbi:PAS domain S-box-containing protein [Natronoarchaeum philippinense]|uniref:histidine kinase n=1 Tax=Natronoarchaeum philippinense TaxID=558529 RepID=A0A285NRT9_NATPI|nr:PAS domain S-box protein [Natronoarchaeum philippinense]SNZ11687.1 PAS domain S-box-containing protein [Natronoarchaeum philippinense]